MTREEAIKFLELDKKDRGKCFISDAIDMAIKALEQEPTTKNDLGVDCIDRNSIKYYPGTGGYMYASKGEIDKLPSVTPQEPKIGHWKLVQRGKNIDICCSNCKTVRIKGYAYNYTIDQLDKENLMECFECADMRYCTNCGARMVEPQESEG